MYRGSRQWSGEKTRDDEATHFVTERGKELRSLDQINSAVVDCRRCPRLVHWREEVAREKRAAFREEDYWGRPVPSFGDAKARLLIVGLAPAAHGANRTGRMFTGDRSGDWLYGALHKAGFASQSESSRRADGLTLEGAYITAAVRCAPPGNRPSTEERDRCQPYLAEELTVFLARDPVVVCLGSFAFASVWRTLGKLGMPLPRPRPKFRHGVEAELRGSRRTRLIGSYHPSQQNTFTGKLTESMFDAIWSRVSALLEADREVAHEDV